MVVMIILEHLLSSHSMIVRFEVIYFCFHKNKQIPNAIILNEMKHNR